MTKLHDLSNLGQAVWLDYIRRAFITSGELGALIDDGLRGVTSNPSIFEKAIAGSTDYDEDLHRLVDQGKSVQEIYEALAVDDIQRAADELRPVYEETEGDDGYVSLEVSPELAYDTEGTISEARRFFHAVDRSNLMIKVPATQEGLPAIETLIGEGINVNVTLMFSLEQYDGVAEAYISGLEKLVANGGDPSDVASVASFFVSRVDVMVDGMLDEIGTPEAQAFKGKIGIANAKMAYARFQETFQGERWGRLADQGARVQRVLWASTSTKDPTYPDTLYVDNLIGPHTVNTLPPATLRAFRDHGIVARTVDSDLDEVRAQLNGLAEPGIDLDQVTDELLVEGVDKFVKPFKSLMNTIEQKQEQLKAGWEHQTTSLGEYETAVEEAVEEMAEEDVLSRIWDHDHTVWKPEPTEITNRLGWLHTVEMMMETAGRLEAFAEDVRSDGYTDVLLLGMGGSSLAPELFSKTFGGRDNGYPYLKVLDSTDPGAVLAEEERLDLKRTLFIVASKSGTTAETLSFFKYFYNRAVETLGQERAGEHFAAVTDPGTNLADIADEHGFRALFLNDPNIGGRYSALSHFGLVPAALVGVDVRRLLDRAMTAACSSDWCVAEEDNPGAQLGAILGELAKAGRDKLTLVTSPSIASFGDWTAQLIAESTGKEGMGILPVVGELLGPTEIYSDDRLFVHLRVDPPVSESTAVSELNSDTAEAQDAALAALQGAGHPTVRVNLHDRYDLGGQFFHWEMATAVAGHRLGINPFNQPNVEAAKNRAREMIQAYSETGERPEAESARLTAEALNDFLSQTQAGDYIALQAYVQPTDQTDEALEALRTRLRDRTKLATTLGYGPRYLHSTGQLHKGDGGKGLFIMFTGDNAKDVPIPNVAGSSESSMSFGVLKRAQALGDQQALLDEGRRVIRFEVGGDVAGELRKLTESL